jgi:hypothetical protein
MSRGNVVINEAPTNTHNRETIIDMDRDFRMFEDIETESNSSDLMIPLMTDRQRQTRYNTQRSRPDTHVETINTTTNPSTFQRTTRTDTDSYTMPTMFGPMNLPPPPPHDRTPRFLNRDSSPIRRPPQNRPQNRPQDGHNNDTMVTERLQEARLDPHRQNRTWQTSLAEQLKNTVSDVAKATQAQALKPQNYTGSKYENVKDFTQNYKRYCMLGKFNNEESIAILSSFLKSNALTWFKSQYNMSTAHLYNTIDMILEHLETEFGPNKLSFLDVESLLDRPQRRNEDFDTFFTDMCERIEICQIPANEQIKYLFKNVLPEYKRSILNRHTDNIHEAANSIRREMQIRAMTRENSNDITSRLDEMQNKMENVLLNVTKQVATLSNTPPSDTNKETDTKTKPPSPCPRCNGDHWLRNCPLKKQATQANKDVTCDYCDRPYHKAKDCRKRQYDMKQRSANGDTTQCSYCGLKKHIYENCRQRLKDYAQPDRTMANITCPYCGNKGHPEILCKVREMHLQAQAQAAVSQTASASQHSPTINAGPGNAH